MATELFPRYIRARVLEALADTRAVVLVGARQVGKSTLADKIVREDFGGATSVTLDDRITREAAHDDPTGFIADIGVPAFIDEVQRGGPDLLLEIKAAVDRDTRPGRFLLTGSANLLSIAKAYEALTGRAEIVHLWPLTQTEIEGSERSFVDAFDEVRKLAKEGVRFALERDDVEIEHFVPEASTPKHAAPARSGSAA